MPTDTPPTKKTARRGRSRLWKVLAFVVALGAGTIVATYHYYTTPDRVRVLCESYLQQFTDGRVTVGTAVYSWREGVRLTDVVVYDIPHTTDDSTGPTTSQAFSCQRVAIRLNPLSLITGGRRVESIIAESPTFAIVRDLADGTTNLGRLFRPMLDKPVRGMPAGAAPIVELTEAQVKVLSRSKQGDRVVDDLTVTIKARSRKLEPDIYDMVWESVGRRSTTGGSAAGDMPAAHIVSDGHSQIDLRTGHLRNVRGGLPWMSIEAVMLAINAKYDAVGAWNDLLGLDGTVRAVDYNLTRDPQGDNPPSATIALNDASISVPINLAERDVPPNERYLRLEDVDGRITMTGEAIHAELDGLFHDSPCHVSATIRAGDERPMTLANIAFEADISLQSLLFPRTDPEVAPDEARFIAAFKGLTRFYRDYQVRGRADLACRLTKLAGADHSIEVDHAIVTARGAGLTWRHFPYPADEVEGVVEYTSDGLFLRGFHGRHGQTEIALEGWVENLKRWSKKRVAVTAKNVVVDDALRQALPERYQRIESRFQPEGTIDVEVLVTQVPGTKEQPTRPQTRAQVALLGVSARYDDFPYPIDDLTGTLVFDHNGARIEALSGRAGSGRVQIDGQIKTSDQKLKALDLAIMAQKVVFDDRLFDVLPSEMRVLVDSFAPEGLFNLSAKLTLDSVTGRILQNLSVMLDGASILHEELPIRLRDVIGEIRISPMEVLVNGLTGTYRGATVSVDGALGAAGDAQPTTLLVRANTLQVDDAIRAALPPAWREQLAAWNIVGPISTETVFRTVTSPTGKRTFAPTSVRLDGVTVEHEDFPIPFHEVRGQLQFDDRGIHGSGLTGRYGAAEVTVDLDIRQAAGKEDATISIQAMGLHLDDALRELLPQRLRTTWDELTPEGTVDLHLDRLSFHRSDADAARVWTADGYAELIDVAIPGLLEISQVTGTLVGGGPVVDRLGGTALSGEFTLNSGDILGRRATGTRSEWSFTRAANGEGVFSLPSLSGLFYGGSVKGAVDIQFDRKEAEYNVSTTVHSVDIDKAINANRTGDRIDVRGQLDGRLHLTGTVGDTGSRRGGGQFEIFDGHIYRVPIILAILNVLDLSLTAEDVFGSARADFLIAGDRAHINDLWIRGAAFALVGGGSMSLPDQAIDIGLVRVNPEAVVSSWSEFVKGAQREIVELRVTGPLSAPTVALRPFPGITDELKKLFQPKKKPGRIRPASP